MNPQLVNVALDHLAQGRVDAAGILLDQLLRSDPEDWYARAVKGALLQRLERPFEATEAWAGAIGTAARRGQLRAATPVVAMLQVSTHQSKQALKLWRSLLAREPTPDAYLAYASFLESIGRPADSIRGLAGAMAHGKGRPKPAQADWPHDRILALVSARVRGREVRIAAAARAQGWRVIMVSAAGIPDLGHIDPYIDDRVCFDDPVEAVSLCRRLRPTLLHLCASFDYEVTAAVLADGLGPVVVDSYDHIHFSLGEAALNPIGRRLERYCLANADGICARSLQLRLLRPGWGLRQPTLFWPEYALPDAAPARPKKRLADGELHVVCGGSVYPNPLGDRGEGNPEDLLPLIRRMARHRVHFHLFPINLTETNQELWIDYRQCAEAEAYFHLQPALTGEDWRSELTSYDLGWFDAPSRLRGITSTMVDRRAQELSFANKVTEYLEAAIHVMVVPGRLPGWIATRLGIGIDCSFDDLDRPAFWDAVRARVDAGADFRAAQQRWSLVTQAPRLSAFYQRILSRRRQ